MVKGPLHKSTTSPAIRAIRIPVVWPRWSHENRPMGVTSKPANGANPEQELVIPWQRRFGKISWATEAYEFILAVPERKTRQRRDATGAPTQEPEWRRGASRPDCAILAGKR